MVRPRLRGQWNWEPAGFDLIDYTLGPALTTSYGHCHARSGELFRHPPTLARALARTWNEPFVQAIDLTTLMCQARGHSIVSHCFASCKLTFHLIREFQRRVTESTESCDFVASGPSSGLQIPARAPCQVRKLHLELREHATYVLDSAAGFFLL